MKKFIIPAMILVVLCGTISSNAAPIYRQFKVDSAQILGLVTTSNILTSSQFVVPFDGPWTLAAVVEDTALGNGAALDSIRISVQKGFDRAGHTSLWSDSATQWIDVLALPVIEPTKRAGAIRYIIDSDSSTSDLARQIGGAMRFVLSSGPNGAVNTADTMSLLSSFKAGSTGGYKIGVYLETRKDF